MSSPEEHDHRRKSSFLPGLNHDSTARRDRRKSLHFKPAYNPRPRWMLHVQATFWRVLMSLGMLFHKLAPPRPPKPAFTRSIPATVSGKPGLIPLQFYVPRDWETQKKLYENQPRSEFRDEILALAEEEGDGEAAMLRAKGRRVSTALSDSWQNLRRKSMTVKRWGGYPVVINFHGGGFTLGTATDDARWCGTVVDECNAVVVSVDYRLAPEHPFPIAVEDGVDAVLWIHEHADELGIDREKIALSGFSSGGNMAFTVPLRLYHEQTGFQRDEAQTQFTSLENERQHHTPTTSDSASSSSTKVPPEGRQIENLDPNASAPSTAAPQTAKQPILQTRSFSDVKIRCLVPWYPSLDYTRTRAERRATLGRPDQDLPAIFTNLFDESYLHPPKSVNLDSPYLSPGVAPTELLREALPEEIILHCCEYDMLLDEGEEFRRRLTSPALHKNVVYKMVEGVPHGWDKAPNPWKPTPGVREHYLRACKELRRVLGSAPGIKEHEGKGGQPSAAPRGSIQVVR